MVPSSAPHEIKDLARREGQKTPDGVLESTPAAKPDHLESLGQPYPAGGVKTFAQKQCVIAQSPGCEEEELDRLDPVLPLSPGRARTPRLRVLPAWHALLVCGAQYRQWPRPRKNRRPPHQSRVRRLCPRSC